MHNFVEAFRFIGRNGEIPGQEHLPTLLYYTLGTVKIAAIAMAISILIALPLGLWLGHIHRGSFVAISLGNVWRALPSLAILAIGLAFFGLGLKNVLLALCVLAVPPIITNAYVAVDGVDPDLVDAARGMGMTGWQLLWRVEFPIAIPLLMAGIRTAALFVVSTTTIAALVATTTASARSSATRRRTASPACSAPRSASRRSPSWSRRCSHSCRGQ